MEMTIFKNHSELELQFRTNAKNFAATEIAYISRFLNGDKTIKESDFSPKNLEIIQSLIIVDPIVKTFKNKNFVKRDYEATNLVFCEATTAPNENWIECDSSENRLNQLHKQNNVTYYGYL